MQELCSLRVQIWHVQMHLLVLLSNAISVISSLSDLRLLYGVCFFKSLEFFFHFVLDMKWNTAMVPSCWRYGFVDVQFDTVVFELSCSLTKTRVFVKVWDFRHQRDGVDTWLTIFSICNLSAVSFPKSKDWTQEQWEIRYKPTDHLGTEHQRPDTELLWEAENCMETVFCCMCTVWVHELLVYVNLLYSIHCRTHVNKWWPAWVHWQWWL